MKWADEVSAKTARARKKPSKPLRFLLESGLIPIKVKVLDYGCGRGTDVLYLRKLGRRAEGWDPKARSYIVLLSEAIYTSAI